MSTYSHSEVDTRNRCHRMWYYAYGLGIESVTKGVALRRGILGHHALEAFFKASQKGYHFEAAKLAAYNTIRNDMTADPDQYGEVYLDVKRALDFFFEGYPFKGWTVIAVEQAYMLDVNKELSVPIVVDLLIEDTYGEIWAIDNKFLYDFPTGVENDILPQLALYAGIARANGINVTRAGYSILRTRSLKTPTVESMYKFDEVVLTQTRIDRNFVEHLLVSTKCHEDKQKPIEVQNYEAIRVKNPRICNACDFSQLCLAELNGHQPELVAAHFYKQRTRRTFQ